MRLTFAALAASLTVVTAATPTPQKIVFARVFPQPGQIGLFIANADGSGERPLLDQKDLNYDAVWAPDGQSLVFTSEREGSADLFRMKPDGTGIERLTDSPAYDDQAAFSPDGRTLVFVTTRNGGTADLWTIDLATKRAKALTSGAGGDFRPSWSPDGKWIAFSSDRESNLPFAHGRWEHLQLADIFIIRPDGSGLKRISAHGNFCGTPKWTADSTHVIAYCMTAEQTLDNRRAQPEHPEDTRIVSFDIATGTSADLKSGPGVKFDPSVLAGDKVAYIRKDGSDTAGIYYADGTRGPKGDVRTAAWSPDGTRVVFHKRTAFQFPTWKKTYSKNENYELTLTGIMPQFESTGTRFVFVGRPPAGSVVDSSIMVARSGTNEGAVIYSNKSLNVMGPSWSMAGDKIIFGVGTFNAFYNGFHGQFLKPEDRSEGGAQIAIVNSDGSGYRELTKGAANNSFPSMAPDGKRFVYRTFGPDGQGLRIMNIETGAVTKLIDGYDNFPLWSPRGDLIMFSRIVDNDYEIFTVKPDGTDVKRLTNSHGNDAHMAWSPDGEHIVWATTRLGFKDEAIYTDAPQPYGELFVMKYDGTNVEQITDNQWEDGTPAWQPATKLVTRR